MKHLVFSIIIFFIISNLTLAQESKKPLDFSVYDGWNALKNQKISNDGKWVCYETNPYKGDGKLTVIQPNTGEEFMFERGKDAVFSPNSNFIVFRIYPKYKKVREQKLKKVKKDKLPKDALKVLVFKTINTIECENIDKFKIPKESSDWFAYTYTPKEKKDSTHKKGKKKKEKNKTKLYNLVIQNPISNKKHFYKNVAEFNISENAKLVGFVQIEGDSIKHSTVNIFDTETESLQKIFDADGLAKKISLDRKGSQSSFIFSDDTTKIKTFSLYYWKSGKQNSSEVVIDKNSLKMPKDWVVSEHCKIWFSKNGSKMYFGTALRPEPEKKDTLLDEEKIKLDVWSWTDDFLQTHQLVDLKKEKERNYLTVYFPDTKKVVRLSDEFVPEVETILDGNADIALGISDKDFRQEQSWDYPSKKDYYTINVRTGDTQIILEKTNAEVHISPFGSYIFWFDRQKRNWFARNIKTKQITDLTSAINANFYDEDHDEPSDVPPYKFAGWTKNDRHFFVYDRYDIWKIDPSGKSTPVNITQGEGRKNKIRFSYLKLDKEITYIENEKPQFLSAFCEKDKNSGYYSINFEKLGELKRLVFGDFNFKQPVKSQNSSYCIWQKSSVNQFPELLYSRIDFKNERQISNTNPQQSKYNWASVELVKWNTFDGKQEEGLLYKPENFDPNKKYPMVVYFYELKSDIYHAHYSPKPSRSIINPLFYASNGYLVFIPNIRYEIGKPGKSAYNYIVSGTKAMIKLGYVDENNIGIHGQSWGGYQVAYLITKTNMYKAALAGAIVSNMTSAYGGIRWKSGISRMFQYEKTQSRLGATLWENPDLYIKNSPLFYADKIETPLLIRHGDKDGSVSWYQGIELFVALRRLHKPAWLINYNGEPHNLKDKSPACKDWSIRMMQFFDHYLKGKPAPRWMTEGIPAIKKGKDLGY